MERKDMNRNEQIINWTAEAALAITSGVKRVKFAVPTGDAGFDAAWEIKNRAYCYDAAKAILFAINPKSDPVYERTGKLLVRGMGATMYIGSDRYPYTVLGWTPNGNTVYMAMDKMTRTDKNGQSESQSYGYEPNPKAPPVKAIWSPKRLRYFVEGSQVVIGDRRAYQDPGF